MSEGVIWLENYRRLSRRIVIGVDHASGADAAIEATVERLDDGSLKLLSFRVLPPPIQKETEG